MPDNNTMSNEQLRQQAETITAIDANVVDVAVAINKIKGLWPYLCGLCTFVGVIIGSTITVYIWNQSLVKQDQFSRHENREMKRDSILNAKMDTGLYRANKRIDNIPVYSVVNATQHKDKYGNITYRNVN